ncbi:MAG: BRCT domain-containing protein [Chlorobium sp.]|nr:BRCT domain-containing protein [Chlorobium sp.]
MGTCNLDQNGQPENIAFNYYANRRKALYSLMGIIEGIQSDTVITDSEIGFLSVWIDENEELFRNALMGSLQQKIRKICQQCHVSHEEVAGIRAAASILVYDNDKLIVNYGPENGHELLLGICKGISSDRILNDTEIEYLAEFLDRNTFLRNSWPGSELFSKLKAVLQDGVITENERTILKNAINSLFGDSIAQGITEGLSTRFPVDSDAEIIFSERTFCLTGTFLHGERKECEALISKRGGIPMKSVTKKLNYLVIGALSSRDWKFSNYGLKIQNAVLNRDQKGCIVKIINEEMWLSAL